MYALVIACAFALAPAPWHHPLSLHGGGTWTLRVPVAVRSASAAAAVGSPVTVRVGRAPGELDLVGREARSVRVCTAGGAEVLFDLASPSGDPRRSGPLPEGALLTLPADCPPHGSASYLVYAGNASAGALPDWLEGSGRLRNAGLEAGSGDAPAGWRHDAPDARHRAAWVRGEARSGKRSLYTRVEPNAEPTWISTRQSGISIVGGARYRFSGWVKARGVLGEAGWYIHVGNAANSMLISPMPTAGPGDYDWRRVEAEFTAPPEADRADLGTVLRGTGEAWFDDVALEQLDGVVALTAAAGRPERLSLRKEPPAAAWWTGDGSASGPPHRTPLRVVNHAGASARGTLAAADLAAVLAHARTRERPGSLRVVAAGRPVEAYRVGDVLLFAADVPPRTAWTAHAYFATGPRRAVTAARGAPAPANPALPGAGGSRQAGTPAADYGRLLASPANLARNASFEQGGAAPAPWVGGAEGERPAGTEMSVEPGGLFGKRAARIRVPPGSAPAWVGWRQDVPVKPGATYLYAAWVRCQDLQGGLQLHAHVRTATGGLVAQGAMVGAGPAISGTQPWTLVAGRFTIPPDGRVFQAHLTMLATGTAWHDGVVVAEVRPADVGPVENRPGIDRPGLAAWTVNALVKVFREDLPPAPSRPASAGARLVCARDEREPLQVALRSAKAMRGARLVVDPLVGPGGARLKDVEVGVVGYVPVDHATNYFSDRTAAHFRKAPRAAPACDGWPGWWPDPILPRSTVDLAAGRTQPVWLTVSVPRGARTGEYRGALRIVWRGKTAASVPFSVRVCGFDLPRQPLVRAIYDCRQSGEMWRVPGKTEQESREAFWRFMARNRLCPDRVQPEPSITYVDGAVKADFTEYDRAARVYFDELGFAHSYTPWQFYLFGWGHLPAANFGQAPYEGTPPYAGVDRSRLRPEFKRAYQACLKAFWDHVKEKGWADRITLYISDEPFDAEQPIREQMKALCDMIHEVDPAIRIYCSTWHDQPEWRGKLDVWGIGHYGVVPVNTMRDLKAGGAALWWTTDGQMCLDTPYAAIERLLPHYCAWYGADAYEFWGIDWLTYDPYRYGWHAFLPHDFGPNAAKEYVRYPNGDGYLAYPPGPLGLGRPVTSIRLEQAREGVEDHALIALLRDRVADARRRGRDPARQEDVLAEASRLVTTPCEIGRYSTRIMPDPDRVLRVKERLARAIEELTQQ